MRGIALHGTVAVIAMAVLAACGSGSSGSVTYAPTVVAIKHIDFTGVTLGAEQYQHPPFTDQYPPVVATVNGTALAGEQLARQEVQIEGNRRNWAASYGDAFPQDFVRAQLQKIGSTDALEAAIDVELKRQAVERLGLLPSHDEAVAYTRQQEDLFLHPQGTVSPENREQTLEIMRQQGFPETNWASVDRIVEGYRQGAGLGRLISEVCPKYRTPVWVTPTPGFLTISSGAPDACSAFLAKERQNAKIVYYVRWAD